MILLLICFSSNGFHFIMVSPLCSLMYGCLSYVKTKKIWFPQLILYLITCIFFFLFNLIIDKEFDVWANILIVSTCLVVVSLVGAFITSLFVPQKRWSKYVIKSKNYFDCVVKAGTTVPIKWKKSLLTSIQMAEIVSTMDLFGNCCTDFAKRFSTTKYLIVLLSVIR